MFKKNKLAWVVFSLLVLLLACDGVVVWSIDEEGLGQTSEQTGKFREALTHYTAALQSAAEGSADDQRLREKIIQVVQKVNPPPAVPEDAKRFLARGRAAVKIAMDEQGFLKAAEESKQALRLAPWLAEGYYNLGLVQDKAGQYADAIRSLKLYLLAAPNAADAQTVKEKVYELDFLLEQEGVKLQEKKSQKAQLDFLLGTWNFRARTPYATTLFGTITVIQNGESIEGRAKQTGLQLPDGTFTDFPTPETLLFRASPEAGNPERIKWEALESGICSELNGFKIMEVHVSPDKTQISFAFPMSDKILSGTGTCQDAYTNYTLTRGT